MLFTLAEHSQRPLVPQNLRIGSTPKDSGQGRICINNISNHILKNVNRRTQALGNMVYSTPIFLIRSQKSCLFLRKNILNICHLTLPNIKQHTNKKENIATRGLLEGVGMKYVSQRLPDTLSHGSHSIVGKYCVQVFPMETRRQEGGPGI